MDRYESITENELCALAKAGDAQAEYALVQKYSSLVKACARPYFLVGGDSEDLIQEGMFGLISAIREFRPDGGASFRAFCELCIRRRLYTAHRRGKTSLLTIVCLCNPPILTKIKPKQSMLYAMHSGADPKIL